MYQLDERVLMTVYPVFRPKWSFIFALILSAFITPFLGGFLGGVITLLALLLSLLTINLGAVESLLQYLDGSWERVGTNTFIFLYVPILFYICLFLLIAFLFYRSFKRRSHNTAFLLLERRIERRSGHSGRSIRAVSYSDIKSVELSRSKYQDERNLGTINIFLGNDTTFTMDNIENSEEVYKIIQGVYQPNLIKG